MENNKTPLQPSPNFLKLEYLSNAHIFLSIVFSLLAPPVFKDNQYPDLHVYHFFAFFFYLLQMNVSLNIIHCIILLGFIENHVPKT